MELLGDDYCFACGKQNPIGLALDFRLDGGRMIASFTPRKEHQGFAGIMHGGLVTTLLDEAMAKLLYAGNSPAITVGMEVRFRKAVRIGQALTISGEMVRERGRVVEMRATVSLADGTIMAEAAGRFMRGKH